MAADDKYPLSRRIAVDRLPAKGQHVNVESTAEERAALAQAFELPAIHALAGAYRVVGDPERATVTGTVKGRVLQTCVVTLEPFETEIEEVVEVEFGPATEPADAEEAALRKLDPPDEIVDGKIDLGALTCEFLALGLDPYPKKPGVEFTPLIEDEGESPFDALKSLKEPKGGG